MTYPVVVLCIAVVAVIGMLLFIVPTFETLFKTLGGTLPAPTLVLVAMSKGLKFAIVPFIILTVVGISVWKKVKYKDSVRNVVDPLKLKVPVFGELHPQDRADPVCAQPRHDDEVRRSHPAEPWTSWPRRPETWSSSAPRGPCRRACAPASRLTKPLTEHAVFPPMVVQMMAVGEDTGALDTMLHKIAEFYDQEVESTTESLTALIEPLMIAFLGGIVGSMIVALYMPIFKIFDLIK